ncbi:Hexaprenyldihydroxybenzoate methyltransferase, mitochondrial, partial [Coemansia sp. RSA 2705]
PRLATRRQLTTTTQALSESSVSSVSSASPESSVSAAELDKFARISDQWWDPQGAFKYLHTMNAPRVQFIRQTLLAAKPTLRGLRAVDVGCGGGLAAERLARLGLATLGIDAAPESIRVARAHAQADPLLNVAYRETTAEALARDAPRFDAVVSLEVIEHVRDAAQFVRSLVELAAPGALVFVSTMNRTPLSWLVDVALPEHVLRVVPRGTHDWRKFVAPAELRDMLRAAGAEPVDCRGLVLDPLRNRCHLVDCDFGLLRNAGVQANYIMAARKHG